MVIGQRVVCGLPLDASPSQLYTKRFCSDYCRIVGIAKENIGRKLDYALRTCVICHAKFQPTGGRQRYCVSCDLATKRERVLATKRAFMNRWRVDNPGSSALICREFRKRHPQYWRKWNEANPVQFRINKHKRDAKRRALGFHPLNSPFAGCEGHHINPNDVIYVPKTLHKSIGHDIWTGCNMERINTVVVQWWMSQVMRTGHTLPVGV